NSLFGSPRFTTPAPLSPTHQVLELFGNFPFTTSASVPRGFSFGGVTFGGCNFSNYTAAVWTNQILFPSTTNFIVQVVFYPTNDNATFTTEVEFLPDFANNSEATIPVVAFHSVDFDIVDQMPSSDSLYVSDALATISPGSGSTL